MKLYNKLTVLLAATALLGSTGCLKDKDYDDGVNQSLRNIGEIQVVSIGLTVASTDNHIVYSFDNSDVDTTFDLIPVQVSSANGAPQDVNVTLQLDPALIGSYNELSDPKTSHDAAPESTYTVLNPVDPEGGYVVTIPRGSNTGYLRVKVKPSDFLGFDYALGFKITKASSGFLISTNLGTGVAAIGIKNKYDGVYSYKGYALRAGDAALTGNFTGKEMALVTAGVTSVKFAKLALWGDGNGLISIDNPILAIDESTGPPNPVTITSAGGGYNNPGYNSVYDPTSQTFYISFTWGAGPAARLSTDTLTYLRPR